MYPATQTFWLEPTDQVAVGLRRYASRAEHTGWTCADGYHSALVYTGVEVARFTEHDDRRTLASPLSVDHADPRWPTHCEKGCGYAFTTDDHWQPWNELLYRRTDTGELRVLRSNSAPPDAAPAEPGASWNAWWMPDNWKGTDGIALMVKCPNGRDWHVDGQASNCTRPGEPHKCWVRHGDPRQCNLTVDKNGDTCSAGAGSIQADDYHGFLQAGVLTAG